MLNVVGPNTPMHYRIEVLRESRPVTSVRVDPVVGDLIGMMGMETGMMTMVISRRRHVTTWMSAAAVGAGLAVWGITPTHADPSFVDAHSATTGTGTSAIVRTIAVGVDSWSIAVDDVDDTVYVTGNSDDTLVVLDGRQGTVAESLAVGDQPLGLAVDQIDDTVYVTSFQDDSLTIIAGRTLTPVAVLGLGDGPRAVGVDQDDDTVYVVNNYPLPSTSLGDVSVIDGHSPTSVLQTIQVGRLPDGIAVNNEDDTVYVVNSLNDSMSLIDGRSNQLIQTVSVGDQPRNAAVNQRDDTVYVTNLGSNTMSVINGGTGTVVGTIATGNQPRGVAVDQIDDTVYVANLVSGTVSVINGPTQVVDATIVVGEQPRGIAVDNAGSNSGLVYVTNVAGRYVSVIARVSSSLSASSGGVGDTLTLTVSAPQVDYDLDDSTVTSVTFGSATAGDLAAGAGDGWTLTVPAGTGTVPVTVTYLGGLQEVAGTFTYGTPTPTPTPSPTPTSPIPATPPLNVTAEAGDGQAIVSWSPPSSSGSFAITNYRVTGSPDGRTCLVAAPALSCTVTGLTNDIAYTFSVQALTGAGWSSSSTSSSPVTPTPGVVKSITITGSRETTSSKYITVTGRSTGLVGSRTVPYVRLAGQNAFSQGIGIRAIDAEGRFTWKRMTGKRTQVYFVAGDVRSNTVTIDARVRTSDSGQP